MKKVLPIRKALLLCAFLTGAAATHATAAVIDLTFEGIAPYPNNSNISIGDFYNGGTSGIGTTGTNYGIHFPTNALLICLNTAGTTCSNTSRGGFGDPASQNGGLFFLTGSSTFLDYAVGFTTGFSFNYSAANQGGSVSVYSGLDGTGTLLATLTLPTTPGTCSSIYSAGFCPFVPIGVTFAGTARSIDFGGTANQIVFDDVTFGSSTPGNNVPEPATAVLLAASLLGAGLHRMRKRVGGTK